MNVRAKAAALLLILAISYAPPADAVAPLLVWLGNFALSYGLGKFVDHLIGPWTSPKGPEGHDWTNDVRAIQAEQRRVASDLESVSGAISGLKDRVDVHGRRLDDLQSRLLNIETRMTNAETRLGNVEADARALKEKERARFELYRSVVSDSQLFRDRLKKYNALLVDVGDVFVIHQTHDGRRAERLYRELREYQMYSELVPEATFVRGVVANLERFQGELRQHSDELARHTQLLDEHAALLREHGKTLVEHEQRIIASEGRLTASERKIAEQQVEIDNLVKTVTELMSLVFEKVYQHRTTSTDRVLLVRPLTVSSRSREVTQVLLTTLEPFAHSQNLVPQAFPSSQATSEQTAFILNQSTSCGALSGGVAWSCRTTLEARTVDKSLGRCEIAGYGADETLAFDDLRKQIAASRHLEGLFRGINCQPAQGE